MTDIDNAESNLVAHARYELQAIGEDSQTTEELLKVVQAFSDMGHSGGSAGVAIAMLNELLQFQNLSPLTDNPDEWLFHGADIWGAEGGVWQNKRNGEAFSHDGGVTYYLLSEGANDHNRKPIHNSRFHKPCSSCGATEVHQHSMRCPNHPALQTGI